MRVVLERGGLVLTATARAARALERRYADEQRDRGSKVWRSPRILDLQSWMAERWHDLLLTGTEDRVLLSDMQEQAVWTAILQPQVESRSLIQPARLAAQAREAYALLARYDALARLDGRAWLAESGSEPELFRRWAQLFEQRCQREHWIPACALPDAITRALRFGQLAAPPLVGFLGFDRVSPDLHLLRRALQAAGSTVSDLAWPERDIAQPRLYTAAGEEQEVAACAAWVAQQLERYPGERIGVLLPDVATRRASLERALYHALSPERFPITVGAAPALPFEFSLGQPLADVPLIHGALLLLRWLAAPLTQSEITWLLLSGTLSWAAHPIAREELARWDARLRGVKTPATAMSLDTYLHLHHSGSAPRQAARALGAMQQQWKRSYRASARPGEWVERVQACLRSSGWGSRSEASSLLFQAQEAWDALLDRLAALDPIAGRVSSERFLQMLTSAARETIFATESEDAPVQVIGALAAAGQQFDAVWFLGATDTAWPAPGRPHPLLPVALQRELAMPFTAPEQETTLARAILDRIAGSTTGEFVVSFAEQTGESVQRPSSLVNQFPAFSLDPSSSTGSRPDVSLDVVTDDEWVPLIGAEAPGGQSALKQQADCPFQAFASRRLNAKELSVASRGLTPGERGNLVHEALQLVWQELRSHDALLASRASGTLAKLVANHATALVAKRRSEKDEDWRRAYLDAEEDRLVRLLLEWLEIECNRAPFTVVSTEDNATVEVGGLRLNLRLDRVDQVEGGRLILDYKTGEVSLNGWEGDRPEQPQLPLYAAFASTGALAGALFAQVQPTKSRLLGRVHDPQSALGLEPTRDLLPLTDEVIATWRDALVRLAIGFRAGEASVDPHHYPATCKFCALPGLCRIAEEHPVESIDESEEEDSPEA